MPRGGAARYRREPMILELMLDGAAVTLRLERDLRQERRALVHVGGYALSHAGTLEAGAMRELVVAIARRSADTDTDTDTGTGTVTDTVTGTDTVTDTVTDTDTDTAAAAAAVVARLGRIVARLAPSARLAIVARALPAPPRWPSRLRTGAPRLDSLWPFDAELAGLRLGLRRLVKREAFDDDAEAADRAWLAAAGVATIRVGPIDPDGRRVLLGALDPRAVTDELRDAEARLRRSDDADAARTLGAALGYPPCCVDRFVAGARDDRSLIAARAADPDAPPASPLIQWLNQPLALISHVPCGLTCAPTIAVAAALLDALDRGTPGFAARWTALAARLQVIDQRGRGLALRGVGSLRDGFRIDHAVVFAVPHHADLAGLMRDAPDAIGRTLHAADVVASADHRG